MSTFSIVLLDKQGREYTATSAREVNDLIFGHGYKPKDPKAVEDILGIPRLSSKKTAATKKSDDG